MVYDMTWWASHGVLYGLAGLVLYMIWPYGHRMVLWYGLAGLAWYIAWPGRHRMVL